MHRVLRDWRIPLTAVLLSFALASAMSIERPRSAIAQERPAAAAVDEGGAVEPKHETSFLWWILKSSGLIGLVILGLSIYFVATVARLFVEFRPEVMSPPDLVKDCEAQLEQRNFQGVYDRVANDDSLFAVAVSTGIKELPNGLTEARDVMDRAGEAQIATMEKKISMLAVLGTLGPMIGLLGTLKGMIGSFSVIALSDTQLKASQVAGGISEALILTFEGVALSVPAIYFFAVFKNRISTLSVNTMLAADDFLRHFAHKARPKNSPAH